VPRDGRPVFIPVCEVGGVDVVVRTRMKLQRRLGGGGGGGGGGWGGGGGGGGGGETKLGSNRAMWHAWWHDRDPFLTR